MSYSLNEIEAMCKRASRGAGLPWGLCEEAAKGTRWLASFGFPGPDLLVSLLELNDRLPAVDLSPVALQGIWRAPAGRLSPLIAGAAMSDCAIKMELGNIITMLEVDYPLLVVPFASGAALRLGQPVAVEWEGTRMVTNGKELCVQGNSEAILSSHAKRVECSAPAQMLSQSKPIHRAVVGDACWMRLGAFAQRTFAPATETSRLRGAGAGLTDND
ncbi:hypothetical protein PsAD13_01995 [Pseudovibrio sp. Ad13]|uniref:DUF3726 domain-containing protein n=1 Tax=Pseudovibrio sp. Ad13 TaxID=989396 RepID=UPI0007AE569D|nr:DUF3726 domain-containing protein [Pseudovibrio sp. Ad13]KZK84531.1 hypothetical protein PsAD13_01995 [Pseudovibrio sp. Ad13]